MPRTLPTVFVGALAQKPRHMIVPVILEQLLDLHLPSKTNSPQTRWAAKRYTEDPMY